jgi:hypothetical protein
MLMDVLVMVEHPVVAENAGECACNSRVLPQLRQRHCVCQCLAAEPLGFALAELLQHLLRAAFELAAGGNFKSPDVAIVAPRVIMNKTSW